jgi:hypothetical protein
MSIYDLLAGALQQNTYGAVTLGQLIDTLTLADQALVVPDGFGTADSWRGVYAFLRFNPERNTVVADMLVNAHLALGKTFQGYKGGDWTMTRDTPCFIDPYGESNDDAAITPDRLKRMLGVDVAEAKPSNMPKRPVIVEMYQDHNGTWGVTMPGKNWNAFTEYVDELRAMTKHPLKVEIEVEWRYDYSVFIVDDAWDAYKEHVCKLEGIAAKLDR